MQKTYRISESQLDAILTKKVNKKDGVKAHGMGKGLEHNPFKIGTDNYEDWKSGWLSAEANATPDNNMSTEKKELGEVDELGEKSDTKNIFTNTIKNPSNIFFDFVEGTLFDSEILNIYNPSINVKVATVKYAIDIQYSSMGIDNISLSPIELYLFGEVEIEGDSITFSKDFELKFEKNGGLTKNTLSGSVSVDGNEIKIKEISNNVSLSSDKIKEIKNNNYIVSSVSILITPNDNEIIFEY